MAHNTYQSGGVIGTAFRQPMLEEQEERKLAALARGAGERAARDRLIKSHLRLVVKIATRYNSREVPFEDLFSEGIVGLIRAADRFDPDRGVRFSTYARAWIRAQILRCLERSYFSAAAPCNDAWLFRQEIEEEDLHQLADSGDGPENIVAVAEEREARRDLLSAALSKLSDRERFIVTNRHLTDRPSSYVELGRAIGLSQERARQIEREACRKLQSSMCRGNSSLLVDARVEQ